MRERTSLEDGLKLLDGLTQETEDSIELIAGHSLLEDEITKTVFPCRSFI